MPNARKRSSEAFDAATAPLISSFIEANSSIKQFTVEPLPTPTMVSGVTNFSAAFAAIFFISCWFITFSYYIALKIKVGLIVCQRAG